jgi:hypothetical protein
MRRLFLALMLVLAPVLLRGTEAPAHAQQQQPQHQPTAAIAPDCPNAPVAERRSCLQRRHAEAETRLSRQEARWLSRLDGGRAETRQLFEGAVRNFRVYLEAECRAAGQIAQLENDDYESTRLACRLDALTRRADDLARRYDR